MLDLTVILPARDEEALLEQVARGIVDILSAEDILYEVLIVDDHSVDGTGLVMERLSAQCPTVRATANAGHPGLGNAIQWGIQEAAGETVAIMMADGSDEPRDLVRYYEVIQQGWDCAFGSRFTGKSSIDGYPPLKLILNRLGNHSVRLLFGYPYDDFTNAFKAYRMSVLDCVTPLRSAGFEVTLELPLRVLRMGASYRVVPIAWKRRTAGASKMRLGRMLRSYLTTALRLRLVHRD